MTLERKLETEQYKESIAGICVYTHTVYTRNHTRKTQWTKEEPRSAIFTQTLVCFILFINHD